MHSDKPVQLILDDGTVFEGKSFGSEKASAGEVVFSTAMVGYTESLTDPSYLGQILVVTFPLVGNYGVPDDTFIDGISEFYESEKVQVSGLIVSDYSHEYSHWNAKKSLGDWLKEHDVPGIYGIDTRQLTKILREKGSMKGKIIFKDTNEIDFYDPNLENQVAKASCKEVLTYGNGDKKVLLVDCGVKHNIIRSLLKRNVTIIRVPWDYDFNQLEWDGLFISNGPGNPDFCEETVKNIRKAMEGDKPICGICMGNQLLSKAGGATIYKLKYGHRSHNQPVKMVDSPKCFITSQNHGFAVANASLGAEWEPLFINLNDGTNEGIKHKTKPFFSAQFHPEASSGPTDTGFLFDLFVEQL
ncbi:carbamoyl-phosphate synthase small subunit [Dysgonomonas sp. PFB1-18]|uniref:glutamine-hydrolyzing carbamoyl-phosphate synthase small subunit n=1 Tax=unclassified Dysgonomonas TaxID=2630389 RepID=UPI00247484C6|nr:MULTISPECIES: glutamine-hydrolyzing carbamoyl-phosphate synthase small subunit [unclassified Dysgonomonas]MDH6310508.1 carbamoyl-phosphate synthase small subunit [Dysgonomonas sp. PF1-14]MDH6340358.1 carbamoyl-phosphate synthase small subunit [Dysgonomonas sp. PF1-16]MDH6382062.1 carbamoyl-phosphate synthase small subunit [Dysgonomonas sp. PFB1-18]MDH6399329.1 carbamoyl-phosphate synthase small subunit [Dysgonomonas sp. PF1-23]